MATMIHEIPEEDGFEHEESTTCDCLPRVVRHDVAVCIHNRMDQEPPYDANVDPFEDLDCYYYSPGRHCP